MKSLNKNIRLFVLAVGVVLVWRGVWGIADFYLFPNSEILSFIFSIIIGIAILYFNDKKLNELF